MAKSKSLWMATAAAGLCLAGGTLIMACGDEKSSSPAQVKVDATVAKAEAPAKVEAPAAP